MNKKILNILFLLAFLFFNSLSAVAGDILYEKSKSGQTFVVKEVKGSETVIIDTWIKTGSVNENEKTSGVAHFLEHLFFKGTEKNPAGTFEKLLEEKGGIVNAATSKDYTHYYILLPAKDFELALNLHSDMLKNPLIPRNELERERLVVVEEISRGQDSPQNVLINNLFEILYKDSNHPYYRPVIGSADVIKTITRDEILAFYNDFYTPDNTITVVVGDVNPQKTLELLNNAFNTSEAEIKTLKKVNYPKIQPLIGKKEIIEEKNVKNIYSALAFDIPKFQNTKECYALDVLSVILGEGKSSRLNKILKSEKHIVNSISSSSSSFVQDGIFLISANYEVKNADVVIPEIFKQIDLIKNGEILEDEIVKAKNMIETSIYFNRESISDVAGEIGYNMMYWGNLKNYDEYTKNIKKVTKEDVIKVAKKYLKNDSYALSQIVPLGYKKEEKQISNVKNYDGKIISKSENKVKYALKNGAELVVQKNTDNSIIAIEIASVGGNHIERIPHTLNLASSLVMKGTKNFTEEEISNFLDENAIGLSYSAGADKWTINIKAVKSQLPNVFYILNELVNNPQFSSSKLEVVKKEKRAYVDNLKDNSLSYAIDKFKGLAFKDSTYSNNSESLIKSLDLIDENEIKKIYLKALDAKNLKISVVGDVDDNELINEFSKIFTSKGAKANRIKDFRTINYVPSKNSECIIEKGDLKTAWVLLGYKTVDIFNEKEKATLEIINAILGDGMASRLFRDLREEKGLAYQVGSLNYQYALDGAFLTYIGTNPKNIADAKNGILAQINTIKTEFVTQKELESAKEKILGNLLIGFETNMDFAKLNSQNAVLERDLEYLEQYKKIINSITQNDVITTANKYFSKPYITVILK